MDLGHTGVGTTTPGARQMLDKTDGNYAPWYIVHSDDKRRARCQLYFPYPRQDPVREGITAEGRAAQAIG